MSETPCPHGHTYMDTGTAGADEISSCCHAPVSWWGDGSGLYCKCCYGSIDSPEMVAGSTRLDVE